MQRAIHNHQGDVYDPFVGSGTTVIAGEQEGRSVYALEIREAVRINGRSAASSSVFAVSMNRRRIYTSPS